PDDREENISMEDYEQKVTLGFDGKQIKYFSYNQKELNRGDDTYPLLTYHYAYSFYIESVGRETKEKFNDIEDLEIFPKK
ncbi:MAG: hypothetical protein K0Q49_1492, partial [Haloplasmataceae bacterium]|nr:hypothetical protein [Haloplasmataceae bacterium]